MRRQLSFLAALSGLMVAIPRASLAEESPGLAATDARASTLGDPRLRDEERETPDTERIAARQLYLSGSAHADAGHWDDAIESYRDAFALYEAPSILYNIGYCQGRLGQLLEGWQSISRAIVLSAEGSGPSLSAERLKMAESERDQLRARLATLTVDETADLSIEGGRIRLLPDEGATYGFEAMPASGDGSASRVDLVPESELWLSIPGGSRILFSPGGYVIRRRNDERVSRLELELREGGIESLPTSPHMTEAPPPAGAAVSTSAAALPASEPLSRATLVVSSPGPAPRPYRTIGIAGLTLGGTSVVVSLVAGGIALSADSQLSAECDAHGTCPAGLGSVVSQYETAATVANATMIAGVVSSVLGAGALILDHQMKNSKVAVTAGPGSMHVRLTF